MKKIVLFFMMLAALSGCRDNGTIPDDDLKSIISDVYLADSYLREFGSNYDRDTMAVFIPILKRYGYTMDDLEKTLYAMSTRKTSRLPGLIDEAVEDYADRLKRYRERYSISLRWDTLSNERATLELMLDSLEAREVADLRKACFELPLYNSGIYTIFMSYKIDSADKNRTYLIKYVLSDTLGRSPQNNGSIWLGRMGKKAVSNTEININSDKYNHMSIDFLSLASGRLVGKPDVDVDSMMVTYRPPLERARRINYERYFGIFGRDTYKFIFYENKKDSSALRVPFRVPYSVRDSYVGR